MIAPFTMAALPLDLHRAARTPLATQIYRAVRDAIETGRLGPGAKLPSWRDMAAQLGVSRGTVRVAYQRLIDEQLAVGSSATRVCGSVGSVSASGITPRILLVPLPSPGQA